jgi:hypothetical protein
MTTTDLSSPTTRRGLFAVLLGAVALGSTGCFGRHRTRRRGRRRGRRRERRRQEREKEALYEEIERLERENADLRARCR